MTKNNVASPNQVTQTIEHPEEGSVELDQCNLPVSSAFHCSQLGHLFGGSGNTISNEKSPNSTSILGLLTFTKYFGRYVSKGNEPNTL